MVQAGSELVVPRARLLSKRRRGCSAAPELKFDADHTVRRLISSNLVPAKSPRPEEIRKDQQRLPLATGKQPTVPPSGREHHSEPPFLRAIGFGAHLDLHAKGHLPTPQQQKSWVTRACATHFYSWTRKDQSHYVQS
ncbi:hypothetical protein NDU88_006396 [Pleurodeles waltl]|uniref:Uncharacterized protein n=1 Tax=Pleurodeles waltl TaxID=8319 RepID=A0AAV7UKV4_PLEWA|nr:hypothetical protein NDU88_006396 [Pleurodeles waltl]